MSKNLKNRILTSFFLILLFILIISYKFFLVFSFIVLSVLSILEFFELMKKIIKNKFYISIINIAFITYLFSYCFAFLFYSNYLQTKIILFMLLLGCIFSDIGGYIFGKIFKGPKLTKISPNKTYSGMFGSIIFTISIFSISIFYITNSLNLKILLYATITSLSCQIGDLFFSFLKRKAKVKDTGNFFPGHGGVLDRIDGILLGVPIGFISMVFL